ncbi:MAG: insulinase family protein [Firmicutes bacterium]|nr:insulinase family protein [Bacillota bacterium]
MEYKSIDCKSYSIHTIKTNRFKTSKIEVIFRAKVDEKTIALNSFLAAMLNESSKKYPTRRKLAIKCEDLYKTYYYCFANKVGDCLNTIFSVNFINPEFISEKDYLENVIEFLFEMINKPNVINEEFDIDTFKIVKNNILLDIESIEENAEKKAINNALVTMDSESVSSLSILGTKEDVEKITPEKLYEAYQNLINNSLIDIFIIGNTNMDNIVKYIKKYYHNRKIRTSKIDYYIENKLRKNPLEKEDSSSFLQSQLVCLYNLDNLTKDEKEITFHLLNYILGSGGLSSKLYRYIREENSYCYRISSMYFKYDNLLCIASSLAKENVMHTVKLITKSIKEMQNGEFTEEDIKDAKQNMLLSLNVNKNNPSAVLANFEFKVFLGNYDINEKIELIEKITKADIVSLAKKIKENTIYVLSEEQDERD